VAEGIRITLGGDVRVPHRAALGVDITEHVCLTAELDLRCDRRPPDTVESLDPVLRNGLTVSC